MLYPTDSLKYLKIHLNKYLRWKHQINNAAVKLNRANAMLSKIRQNVDIKALKSIHHAISESFSYASLVWAQNSSSIRSLHILQKRSLRLIFVHKRNAHRGNTLLVFTF